jgi:hypothetical protein
MSSGAQILKFVLADFDKNWHRTVATEGFIVYTATVTPAHVAVVREGPTGVFSTYRYAAAANEAVWVIKDVIHLPERCVSQAAGNTITCEKLPPVNTTGTSEAQR